MEGGQDGNALVSSRSFDGTPYRMIGRKPIGHHTMYYLYILRLANGQLYTGFTKNLRTRLKNHQGGSVQSTRTKRPLTLVHYEAYLVESDARRREKFLKTTEGKRLLKQQIRDLLTKLDKQREGGQDGNALVSKTSGRNP